MHFDFDSLTEQQLRTKACAKWQHFDADVLPLWVADMDFPVAEPIKAAIREHLDTNNFGYPEAHGLPGLKDSVINRLRNRYNWTLEADDIELVNGIVPGLFLNVQALSSAGESVLIPSPVYGPFTMAVTEQNRTPIHVPLNETADGWQLDFEALDSSVTPETRVLMLCNPHNPLGRVFTRDELEKLAALVLKHRLWVVSDELHSDLVFDGQHIPFASLSDEIAQRTVTLFGPTKTFNIAGLKVGFMVTQNKALMARLKKLSGGMMGKPNVLGQTAALAAYEQAGEWLDGTLAYLDANRQFIAEFVREHMQDVRYRAPEGTYLGFLDFRQTGIAEPATFALEHAKVAMNDGAWFGPGGEGFVRINFATSRGVLSDALTRIAEALRRYKAGEIDVQSATQAA